MQSILDGSKQQDREFALETAGFQSTRSLESRSKSATTFQFVDRTRTRDFSTTAFSGGKNAWLGENKLRLTDARTRGYADAGRTSETKAHPTERWSGSEKSTPTRAATASTRPFLIRGRSQDAIDANPDLAKTGTVVTGWEGGLQPMTIEQVRDLLNKNK
jgi:hypothetical protein